MKPDDIKWLKQFLAAERGVTDGEVSDAEVVSRHRRLWLQFFLGLLSVFCAYFVLKSLVDATVGRGFVVLIAVIGLWFEFRRFRSAGSLTAGPVLLIKKQSAEKLKVSVSDISDAAVQDFDRRNTRAILMGLLLFALVSFLADWVWPNSVLELLIVLVFYSTGMLAWRSIGRWQALSRWP